MPYPDLKNARDVGHREHPGVTIGGTAASGAGGSDKRRFHSPSDHTPHE